MANPHIREGVLTSETVGLHTGIKPLVRPRPASDVTIMLRNPAVRDGHVSSEPVGNHTGVPPRRTAVRGSGSSGGSSSSEVMNGSFIVISAWQVRGR